VGCSLSGAAAGAACGRDEEHRPHLKNAASAGCVGLHRGGVDLTERERALLAFERHWWRYGATRADAARARFGLGGPEHGRIVGALIDRPEALAVDAVLVRRLQRMRTARRLERSGRAA
jgi:hypothetical protein